MTVCRVAVSQATYAIDRLYDYHVPEQLIDDVVPGVRVLVPFGIGNRKCEAFVVTMGRDTGEYKLKSVSAVLDDAPVLSESLLHLAAQMCSGLYCTFYDCAKSMLPTGLWFDRHESWSVREEITDEQLAELAQSSQTLAMFNKGARELTTRELAQACGGKLPSAALKSLQEKGILQFHSSFDRKVNDRTIRMYGLDVPAEEAFRRVEKGRSPVRMDVVSCLASEGAMARRELMYLTGASSAVLRTMVRQNILREWQEEAFRLPDFSDVPAGEPFTLNAEQQAAYDSMSRMLDQRQAAAALLFGVTGSGKTQVYLSLIRHAVEQGRGAILLVPEIGLTPQMIRKFVSYFGDKTAVLH
ncbi:MAG: DEAD/DEAH box helicase family protein, partial [Butyricicoccaceae bacterium]